MDDTLASLAQVSTVFGKQASIYLLRGRPYRMQGICPGRQTIKSPAYEAHSECASACAGATIMSHVGKLITAFWKIICTSHGRFWRSASPDLLSRGGRLARLAYGNALAKASGLESGIASPYYRYPVKGPIFAEDQRNPILGTFRPLLHPCRRGLQSAASSFADASRLSLWQYCIAAPDCRTVNANQLD